MADIFISYSSEDRQKVIPVVKALESQGWSVWWDRIIPPGKTFSKVIEDALEDARCLIVLWTETSVASDWVSNEAAEGARRGILIPALLDDIEIPFEFRRIQAANLIGWRGETVHPGFQQLVKAAADLIGPPPPAEGPAAGIAAAPRPSRPLPPETPAADAFGRPRPSPPAEEPAVAPAHRKSPVRRIGGWIVLAVTIAAGAAILLKADLFQGRRPPQAESEQPPRVEAVAPPVHPEPENAAGPGQPPPEAPPSEKQVAAAAIAPEPGTATGTDGEEPRREATADAGGPSSLPAAPEPPKAAQPAVRESRPEAPAPVAKPPAPPVKPPPQKPPRTGAGEPPRAEPAPDAKALAGQVKPLEPTAAARPREAAPRRVTTNSIGMGFVLIPASTAAVTMGSRLGIEELVRRFGGTEVVYKSEKPPRPVRIERPFYMLTTPVTQGQWRRVMGTNPSSFKDCGEDCPVETVSWEDAQRFVARLNQMEGAANYRLPTEAEWEYAARAGNESEFFFGDDGGRLGEFAWYSANSSNRTHPVGRKTPNAWGLYDTAGNVWEWVEDDWHAGYAGAPSDGSAWSAAPRSGVRVVRGGDWGVIARYCRSAARYYANATTRNGHMGFRIVSSAAPQ